MSKIFYTLSGEGRGHAARVRAVIEELRKNHEVTIYTSAYAYQLLTPVYRHTEVEVRYIPCLHFHYGTQKKLNYWKTGWHGLRFITHLPHLVHKLQEDIETEMPDLIITDYEPALPRAARRCGVPFISLNHQHFLLTYDLNSLPRHLKRHVGLMAMVVRSYYSGQAETIVSSFYFPPLKPECKNVTQIGVLLCPEIVQATTEQGRHIVAYLRRFASLSVLNAFEKCGCEIHIYGLGAQPSRGSLRFFGADKFRFVEDLATSRALISTAGNQLVGEAIFLGKPVLAMPECGNFEQKINAYFLEKLNAGVAVEMEHLTTAHILKFLESLDKFCPKIDRRRLYGNPMALGIINRYLSESSPEDDSMIPIRGKGEVAL
ncbi:MAG: teichoic acid biosynthesis protein [Candidatus Aminicenantes bacterium]|nr:teichoic acid biosynthesis protein [Candidatus Aminicenantes bacterium]